MSELLESVLDARQWQARADSYRQRPRLQRTRAEHAAGRAEYVRCQRAIAERAAPLRAALLARCDLLMRVAGCE